MAIILGFENAGIFSLAVSISSVSFAFAVYGVRGYQVSDIKKKYSDKTYVISRMATCLLSMAGGFIYLAAYKYNPYTALCIAVYIIFKTSEAYVDVYHGIIQRSMRMDFIGKSFILRGIISSFLFILSAILTKNLLLSILVLAISSFILIFLYDYNKVKPFYEKTGDTSVKSIMSLLVECLPLALYAFLSNLVMSIPRIYLDNIKDSEILGIYASIAIPAAIVQVLAGYIFSPMLTVFAEHIDQKLFKLFHKLLFKTLMYVFVLSVVTLVGGYIFGEFGLVLLFGEKIRSYAYLFFPILIISSLTAFCWFIGLMLTVLREFRGLIISSLVAALICFLGSNMFINTFGPNGTSFVLILALAVQLLIMSAYMMVKLKKVKREVIKTTP